MNNKSTSQKVYGFHAVKDALDSGRTFDKIFIQKGIADHKTKEISTLARSLAVPVSRVPIEKMNRLSRKNHQGIIGISSPIEYILLDQLIPNIYENGESPFLLILDEVTDVRNFGAIARTAEAMGVHGIIIPIKRSASVNDDAVKTSAGVLNYLPVCRVHSLNSTAEYLKDSGLQLIGCSEEGNKKLGEIIPKKPCAIILGSEEYGIHPNLLKKCDEVVNIPMRGKVGSLNVSVAAGIILHYFSNS